MVIIFNGSVIKRFLVLVGSLKEGKSMLCYFSFKLNIDSFIIHKKHLLLCMYANFFKKILLGNI